MGDRGAGRLRQGSSAIAGTSVLVFGDQKRKRVSNSKVRTGCVTCKIRRLKCDETKPACDRCTKTGRVCDGYVDPPPRRKAHAAPTTLTAPSRSLQFLTGSPSELNALSYFYRQTAPKLSSNFDADFWSRLIFQMCHAEDSIKFAMVAVGALDAQREERARLYSHNTNDIAGVELESSRSESSAALRLEGSGQSVSSHGDSFALQSYNKAVVSVANLIRNPDASVEVVLLACILFVYVEILRGDIELCLRHIKGGTCIAISMVSGTDENSSPGMIQRVRDDVLPIFNRLELLSMLFGSHPAWKYPVQISQAVPPEFESLKEARDSGVHVMNSTYRFIRCVKFRKYDNFILPDDLARQTTIKVQSEVWMATFDRFIRSRELNEKELDIARTLELHHINGVIWVEIGMQCRESYSDNFFDLFERSISLAERMHTFAGTWMDRDTLKPNFLFDMEIISPLYLTAVKCRHPVIRRRAVTVLKKTTRREGLWDSHMAAAIAEKIIAIEEADLTVLDGSELPSEEKRIHTLHVQSLSSTHHKITFYSKPHGLDGPWRIWHEDIVLNRGTIERNHPHAAREIPPHNYYETNEPLSQLLNEARVQQYGFDGLAMRANTPGESLTAACNITVACVGGSLPTLSLEEETLREWNELR